jgi:hypothetical protein
MFCSSPTHLKYKILNSKESFMTFPFFFIIAHIEIYFIVHIAFLNVVHYKTLNTRLNL